MITGVDIDNLRGIGAGSLTGLTGFTVLTGVNGCGKSTVLDALLLAVSPSPADALVTVLERRPQGWDALRWLVRGGTSESPAGARPRASVVVHDGDVAQARSVEHYDAGYAEWTRQFPEHLRRPPFRIGKVHTERGAERVRATAANGFVPEPVGREATHAAPPPSGREPLVQPALLLDPGVPRPLEDAYSLVAKHGRRKQVIDMVAEAIRGATSLDVFTNEGHAELYITIGDGPPVPIGLAGDGVQAFVQLAVELATLSSGVALVEEPETSLHPRAIHEAAKALLVGRRRGLQVVVTTHSVELIDALLQHGTDADVAELSVFVLDLKDGALSSTRFAGAEIVDARERIGADLR